MVLLSAIGTSVGVFWMLMDTPIERKMSKSKTVRLMVDLMFTAGMIVLASTTGTQGALFTGLISGFVFTALGKWRFGNYVKQENK